jgi:hypothetical protein
MPRRSIDRRLPKCNEGRTGKCAPLKPIYRNDRPRAELAYAAASLAASGLLVVGATGVELAVGAELELPIRIP